MRICLSSSPPSPPQDVFPQEVKSSDVCHSKIINRRQLLPDESQHNFVPRIFYSVLPHSLEKDPGCGWSRVFDQNNSFREGRPFQSLHSLCVSPRLHDVEEYKMQCFPFLFAVRLFTKGSVKIDRNGHCALQQILLCHPFYREFLFYLLESGRQPGSFSSEWG